MQLVFLMATRAVSLLRLSRQEEWQKDTEIGHVVPGRGAVFRAGAGLACRGRERIMVVAR